MPQRHRKPVGTPAEASPADEDRPTVRQPGVLVADDDNLVRIMLRLGLERNGFEVWSAANGRQAIDLYREHQEHIGVVLLDVRMPGLDGPETLGALRELNPGVRACFMSGATGIYKAEDLMQRGTAYVIVKPFQLEQLANVLRLMAHDVPAGLLPFGGKARGEGGQDTRLGEVASSI